MWKRYKVVLQVHGQFGASIPQNPKAIVAMLENRAPQKPPEDFIPIENLAEQVAGEVEATEEAAVGLSTFKRRDGKGLYYEGRCVRGHLKDCAQILAQGIYGDVKAFRSKVTNRLYVETNEIWLGKQKPDETEVRFIQVMTAKGPRASVKQVDYVDSPRLEFVLRVLDDGVFEDWEKVLRDMLEYGGVHGIGAERSQGWGRYEVAELVEL